MAKGVKTTRTPKKVESEVIDESTKNVNKVEQEVIEDDNPKPARTKAAETSQGRAFVKIHNSQTGLTQEVPGTTADRLSNKYNHIKIVK